MFDAKQKMMFLLFNFEQRSSYADLYVALAPNMYVHRFYYLVFDSRFLIYQINLQIEGKLTNRLTDK